MMMMMIKKNIIIIGLLRWFEGTYVLGLFKKAENLKTKFQVFAFLFAVQF